MKMENYVKYLIQSYVHLSHFSLNVRIILLIRDPRGALQSRKHRDWCPGNPDCDHPPTVCSDMVSDYESAVKLNEMYPNTFKYELLCMQYFYKMYCY